jgi:hypothetical protein
VLSLDLSSETKLPLGRSSASVTTRRPRKIALEHDAQDPGALARFGYLPIAVCAVR